MTTTFEPRNEQTARAAIRALEGFERAVTMARELRRAVDQRSITDEVLKRHSRWCNTGGAWLPGREPARLAAEAMYGFVPDRLVDGAGVDLPDAPRLLEEYHRRLRTHR